jgi:hypothetical protein
MVLEETAEQACICGRHLQRELGNRLRADNSYQGTSFFAPVASYGSTSADGAFYA